MPQNYLKKVFSVDGAPPPRAAYSTYVQTGDLIFIAGQVAIDPQSGSIPANFEEQLKLVFQNLKTILESAGSSLADIVKTTVFLKDISDYPVFDNIYKHHFPDGYPARSTIVADLVREEFLVEIEAVARVTGGNG
jgi:2-iminobutanoate/2-iminopropanoate deaminase